MSEIDPIAETIEEGWIITTTQQEKKRDGAFIVNRQEIKAETIEEKLDMLRRQLNEVIYKVNQTLK